MSSHSILVLRYPDGRSEFRDPATDLYEVGDTFESYGGGNYVVTQVDGTAEGERIELTLAEAPADTE